MEEEEKDSKETVENREHPAEPVMVSIRKTDNGFYVTYGFVKGERVFYTKAELLNDLAETWETV